MLHLEKNKSKLSQKLDKLRGVGPSLTKTLNKLGLNIIEDLLFLMPLRYEDRTRLYRLGELKQGMRCQTSGQILLVQTVFRGRRSLQVRLGDNTGQITIRFFYFSKKQLAQFEEGKTITCFGNVRFGANGHELIHPEYRILKTGEKPTINKCLTPVYPLTDGIQQGRIRNLVNQAISLMKTNPPKELLPKEILKELSLPKLTNALIYLHNPPEGSDLVALENGKTPSQLRLSFEELLAHYMSLRQLRIRAKKENAIPLNKPSVHLEKLIQELPYSLTLAQNRVIKEIDQDVKKDSPMMRLIQGDVGSGKTVVAAASAAIAISNNVQIALMAPTELLAEQHFKQFEAWFHNPKIKVTWLSGSQKANERSKSLDNIVSGKANIIIGTHALFQESVKFNNLGLIIIDEQHRFGVHQRLALRNKGSKGLHPHQLVMTATPIPRTLAMAAYADLDTSIIDELPPGRQSIITIALPQERRSEVIQRLYDASKKGRQAYWVCPLIEESETLNYQAAEESYKTLSEKLKNLKIGLIHGRMKMNERNKIMTNFKNGYIDVLVATTVIEVGVDVPNATLMIIENAERMGLSQLHQLRGRVGRGENQSHCVLLYKKPLGEIAKNRLSALRKSNDGFFLAQRDLELRGPGELLGTRQTGLPEYRIANLVRDSHLIPKVQKTAITIQNKHSKIEIEIANRWLGNAHNYGKV